MYAVFVGIVIICKDALFILVDLLHVCDKSLFGKKDSYLILSLDLSFLASKRGNVSNLKETLGRIFVLKGSILKG